MTPRRDDLAAAAERDRAAAARLPRLPGARAGLSRNTLEAYRSDLLQFGEFLERRGARRARRVGHGELAGVPRRSCRGRERPPVTATLARKVACLRSFYRHLRREGAIEHDPTAELRGPRKPQRLPRVLTPRARSRACSRSRSGTDAAGAARPRAARADVRVRAARLGGDRARAGRRRPRGGAAVRARQGLQGADRADRAPGAWPRCAPTARAGARRCSLGGAARAQRGCSSTAAAAALTRQGLYKIVQGHAAQRRPGRSG